MAAVRLFIIWAVLGLVACAPARPAAEPLGGTARQETKSGAPRGLDSTKVDAPKLDALFAQRVGQAIARPEIDRAIEELLTGLVNDETLGKQGAELFDALGNDPQLVARGAALQESWSKEPAMVELVMRLMAEHPGASPDGIGELAGQHIERQIKSRAFDQAFELATERLFERSQLKAAFDHFGDAAANNPHFERGFRRALHEVDYAPIAERLLAFNGGSEPDAAAATQILIDHAFTTDRFEALLLDWLHMPETRSELRRLISDVFLVPSFRERTARLFTQLLSDRDMQRGLRDCFVLLLEEHPDPEETKMRLRRAIDTPRMDSILASFLAELMKDPALQALGSRFLERVTNSPAFAKSVQRFMSAW